MPKTSFVLAALVAAIPLTTSSAFAESKAFAAAKANLADNANIAIGINVASITGSKLFQTFWPLLLAKAGDGKEGLELAKTACNIDVMTAVTDVVVAMDKTSGKGAVFLGLKGINQAKVESCAAAVGKAKHKPVPTFKKDGSLIEVTPETKDKDKKYYTWIGTDVIAMATEGDKDSLVKWTAGKGTFAKGALGGLVAKTNTTGAVWGATTVGNTLQPGVDVKSGYGSVAFDKGTVNADVHAIMTDAKSATTTADTANKQIAAMKGNKQVPPGITAMLGGIKITTAGSEIVVKASLTEANIQSLMGLVLGGMGGGGGSSPKPTAVEAPPVAPPVKK